MKCSEAPHQVHRVYSDDLALRKRLGDDSQRMPVIRVVECRNYYNLVSDVKVRVAGRQSLTIHDQRTRIWKLDCGYSRRFQSRKIFCAASMIWIIGIGFVGEQHFTAG